MDRITSEQRKAQSERILRDRNVPFLAHLPLIESEDEITLRSEEEVMHRLVALWAVAGTALLRNDHFRNYINHGKYQSWLSARESAFLFSDNPTEKDIIHFSWQLECLYFIAWCAGLIERIEIPTTESSAESIMGLYPRSLEPPDTLARAIRLRSKSEILDWSDLLYRLHWAVRDRGLNQSRVEGINGGVVQEWHRAVNWITRYDDEDDWDLVSTDT